ncbi:O-antigen ligase family protein [Enterococcus innesii]|uniref:O-antigen ligase family protein n=1 Tax=Enterococcus innesii TaxID=2839759 RepID=UPI0034A1FF37
MILFFSFFFVMILIGYLKWGKNWPLMCFVFFFPILPDYFALPLRGISLTGSRFLILILFVYFLLHKRKINRLICLFRNSFFKISILFYFSIIFVNLFHLKENSDSWNMIVQIIIEQMLVVILLSMLINSKEKIIDVFDVLSKASFIVSLFAIFETLFSFNLFYLLKTVESGALQTSYERAGFLRAEVGFGHPVYFGFYSLVLFIMSLFLYRYTKKSFYKVISIFNVLSIFLSGTRGSIICLALVVFFVLIFAPTWLLDYYKLIPIFVLAMIYILLFNSNVTSYFLDLIKSIFNFFGANYSISNFGTNSSGGESRLAQLSLFEYLRNTDSLIFGLGAKAQVREIIYYRYNGLWQQSNTYDIGYLAYLGDYGIIGFTSYILYIFLWHLEAFKLYFKSKQSSLKVITLFFVLFILAYAINLFNSVGINSIFWIVTALFISFSSLEELKLIGK